MPSYEVWCRVGSSTNDELVVKQIRVGHSSSQFGVVEVWVVWDETFTGCTQQSHHGRIIHRLI